MATAETAGSLDARLPGGNTESSFSPHRRPCAKPRRYLGFTRAFTSSNQLSTSRTMGSERSMRFSIRNRPSGATSKCRLSPKAG